MHNSYGFNKDLDSKRFEIINPFIKGKHILEVGPGNGHMTKKLRKEFVVDTTDNLENFYFNTSNKNYNTILCTNVIEHIKDTTKFLDEIKKYGDKKTTFIFSVPNAESHNRLLGCQLGKIEYPSFLDKQDIAVGHKKMYDTVEFDKLLTQNGFNINKIWTHTYKPFPNSMMNKLPKEIKKFCLDMELKYYGAEIFVIAKKC